MALGTVNVGTPTKDPAGYAAKSEVVSATLLAANWTADGTYTWSNAGILSAEQIVELMPASGITAEQLEALQTANIVGTAQAVGSLTMTAFGEVPTIDIPVIFVMRGDV